MSAPTEDVLALAPPARAPGAVLLDWFERVGNRFPDPIVLFLAALAATWAASSLLAGRDFGLIDPRTHAALQIAMLLLWWLVGLPLGIGGRYVVP